MIQQLHKNYLASILFFLIVLLAACDNDKNEKGWTELQRQNVIDKCMGEAITGSVPQAEVQRLRDYCSCYQQALEQQFPIIDSLAKVTAGKLADVAEDCIKRLH